MSRFRRPFIRSAAHYDAVYAAKGKAYRAETTHLLTLARETGAEPTSLLDVACGTGEHLRHFALDGLTDLAGVDATAEMVAVAREKVPDAFLDVADMCAFDIGRRFDLVTCLFSSIGYLETREALDAAIAAMARHRAPGGFLLIEPPVPPLRLAPPERQELHIETAEGGLRRETTATIDEATEDAPARLVIRFRYELPTVCFEERHAMSLFRPSDVAGAMEGAGLRVRYDARGPSGIGLYVGSD